MKQRYLAVFLSVLPLVAMAADAIEGAFGIRLGEPLDVSGLKRIETASHDEGGEVYAFTPEHPYPPLDEYTVVVGPVSHRVYSIRAVGTVKNRTVCREELANLERVLSRKYGRKNPDPAARMTGASRISFGRGARRITASCAGLVLNYKLQLVYYDKAVAAEEKQARPAGKATRDRDTSGL
ncbi:MAG TPA: hypothetical protein ENK48_07530 [Gammaproteobacteria bacterium]|nr:hypothetical protein [Gammaproteobacteria bacterium]